jgi:hypothetical protein
VRVVLLAALVAFVVLSGTASGRVAAASCGEVRAQGWNGNQVFVPGNGPQCLYRAYRNACSAASFTIKMMGVDTLGSLEFRAAKVGRACRVHVAGKNTVYAGHPRTTTWRETCRLLAKRSNGIAVTGCDGKAGDYLLSPPRRA